MQCFKSMLGLFNTFARMLYFGPSHTFDTVNIDGGKYEQTLSI